MHKFVNKSFMFTTVIRVFLTYVLVLIILRVMGKRQIGQMQPYEFVITLIIADLATIPMSEHTLPLLYGLVPVLTLLLAHNLFTFLSQKSMFVRKILNGKSIVIMNPDGIDYQNLQKLNLTFNDLIENVRQSGLSKLDDVAYAIVETSGKISIIPKAATSPVSCQDLAIKKSEVTVPTVIISDGKIMESNSKFFGIEKEKIENLVKKIFGKGCQVQDVCILTIDQNGQVFAQKFGESAISTQTKIKGNAK